VTELPLMVDASNLIAKADAGARLFYAIYGLPQAKVKALFEDATPGFFKAYMQAQRAFMGEGQR
jgi:hypothetical protein